MKISVIIPVYNAERTIKECLEHLAHQDHTDYEIILVDNRSTDSSREIIEGFIKTHPGLNTRLISEPRQGATMARNTGAKTAQGNILANIDPDCLTSQTWLSDMNDCFQNWDIAMVAGNIESQTPVNIFEKFSALFTLPGIKTDKIYSTYDFRTGGFATANLAVRKEWFDRVNGFDEALNYHGTGIAEDHDLCKRIYDTGGKLLATPRAKLHHWHRGNLKGIARQGFLFGLAQPLLLGRYGAKGVLLDLWRFQLRIPAPFKGWLNFDLLDKKLFLMFLISLFWHPFFLILPLYFLWFARSVILRAKQKNILMGTFETIPIFLLMLIKAAGMTLGRLTGSFKFKVACV